MQTVVIHKAKISDVDTIVSFEADVENLPFISPNSKEEHQGLFKNDDVEYLLFIINSDQIIGFAMLAGLTRKDRHIEFRRIVISKKGKGFGRMAIKLVKEYCFEQLNCQKLWLDVLESNKRAHYLYASENFKIEEQLNQRIAVNGIYHNLIVMSIIKEEC